MQEKYLSLGSKEVHNGEYLLAVFRVLPKSKPLKDIATEVAAESSNGSNMPWIKTNTLFSDKMGAQVYDLDEKNNLVYIAYPWRIFDRGGNIQNVLTFIVGNVMGMSNITGCKLLDVWFPTEMLSQYDGPSYTIDDMRDYLKSYHKPVLGTIIKPKIGLSANEYAEACYDFWVGGGEFVKNDEPQADQDFAPFKKMVKSVREAMDRAEDETGSAKIHSFNVSAADFHTMIDRADYVAKHMKPGSYALLVDGITAGWTAVQTIRRNYPNAFLHFHRAGHGAFTREENPFGFTVSVLTKMARLAGTSGIHTGTAGVGKMAGTVKEDVSAAHHALRIKSKGDYFDQVWAEISEEDDDVSKAIKLEQKEFEDGPYKLAQLRKTKKWQDENAKKKSTNWRALKKCAPIASGGLNPVLLSEYIEKIGTIDFIVTMGAGVHAHPQGTKAGAKAVTDAYEAWFQGKTLDEASKQSKELKEAIKYFDKYGTQAEKKAE